MMSTKQKQTLSLEEETLGSSLKHLEMSTEDMISYAKQLVTKIDFNPDLVVFIAKGSYQIGEVLAESFCVPLVEITAKRFGDSKKDFIKPILRCLPSKIKFFLRKVEIKLNVHNNSSDRSVKLVIPDSMKKFKYKKIILVDDSVDTGHSILAATNKLLEVYPNAEVKVAAFNVFDSSKQLVDVSYSLFENKMLLGPWSKDSKEYQSFLATYKGKKSKGVF